MRNVTATGLWLVLAAGFAVVVATPHHAAGPQATPENKLLGTWRLVSAKYNGQEFTSPEGSTTVKHVTPAQFMWATYDKGGTVTRAAGGHYRLTGAAYEETPEYGLGQDFEIVKGKAQPFTWRVEGTKWYHTGKLSNGTTIEEVWEREEKP